jgi:hypothetical protein
MLTRGQIREGGLAKPIEKVTARVPSDTFLWLSAGSIIGALVLRAMGKDRDAIFVGEWAPVFLILGLYNKLVKVSGHDQYENVEE